MKIFKIAETISLEDMGVELEGDLIQDFVSLIDMDVQLPVSIIGVKEMEGLKVWSSSDSVIDTYRKFSTRDQKRLVSNYMKSNLSNEIVVVYGNNLIDGHHRGVAAIKSNQNMKKVDLYDLGD